MRMSLMMYVATEVMCWWYDQWNVTVNSINRVKICFFPPIL